MEKKLIRKMIQKCFLYYRHDKDILPLSDTEFEEIYQKIIDEKALMPDLELHEIVHDAVYEFLST